MAATVTGRFRANVQFSHTPDSGFYSGVAREQLKIFDAAFAAGTAAGKVDLVFPIRLDLVASTPQSLNLQSLVDPNGATITGLARVRVIVLWNEVTTDAAFTTVAPNGTNGWDSWITGTGARLRGSTSSLSSLLIGVAPDTTGFVVDATHRMLDFTPSAHAQTIKGLIAGCSL